MSIAMNNSNSLNLMMELLRDLSINNNLDEFKKFIMDLDRGEEILTINNINFCNSNIRILGEIFCHDYFKINVKDRYVIDIGANIADTALMFAKLGAKKVIGFEPVEELYGTGLKNINLNKNLKDKIQLVNKGVSGKKGKLKIQMESTKLYINKNDDYEVEIITISDILKDYDIKPDILKMDCEGCEFEIIKNSDLSMFNDIIFEHHSEMINKDYNVLIDILKNKNFNIKKYPISNKKYPAFNEAVSFEDIGIIHAYK
jgi:FkbM family methyltransferase